ncbi:hypothetical protein BE04_37715 [Sorangium cellulosum]|uniref:Uncharacterized protein n=1 Tax=Sorangium cellulosum TaxID=56 RepID=A0A150P0T9_SORCE|nr:hypothetical protein BE04_37715 [Sorangium cellulosum]
MGDGETPGLFEMALGFRTSTKVLKAVHVMNDLAQVLIGGAPEHGGDLLARVIRAEHEEEGNSDRDLRAHKEFGARYSWAFPAQLGAGKTAALRRAAKMVLNFDGGVYEPGTSMASALATHRALLGFEQFRRFRLGAYLSRILTDEGKARLRAMYESDLDPVSKTFRPLLFDAPLVDRHPPPAQALPLKPFDHALGARLSTLLAQPLSKPALLRKFALGATLGLVLKVLGCGRPGGRPMLLALAVEDDRSKPLRDAAVMSFRAGVSALDRSLATMMAEHPLAPEIKKAPKVDAQAAEVRSGLRSAEAMLELIAAIRRGAGEDGGEVYWPDQFAMYFGRKAGCVLPKADKAGWGVHLALSGEFVELLVLMSVPRDAPPAAWRDIWRGLRDDLGLMIGASAAADAEVLRGAGVEGVSLERLTDNASLALDFGVRLGVARRLPDSGAEAGGGL